MTRGLDMAVRPRRGRLVLIGAGALVAGLVVPSFANAATAKANWGNFDRSGIGFNTLQPRTVTVHKGDKVQFTILGFHTLVIPKAGAKVPELITPTATLNPATNDPAGQPYWWGGTTPILDVNVPAVAPSGGTVANGRTTVNSGIIEGNAPKFTVTFPKVGTFQIRCAVHRFMKGTVKVVNGTGPSNAALAKRAANEQARQLATAKAAVRKADRASGPVVAIGPGNRKAESFSFEPANRTVAAGTAVTFSMDRGNEIHTVTFGPKAFVVGNVARNFFPSDPASLALGSEAAYPSNPPAAGIPSLTPTTHGNGFLNSGLLADKGEAPNLPSSFTVTFPVAGTFEYHCVVHPEMEGTITVR
jgi:plastocyanin